MARQIVTSADAPSSPLFSQAVKAGPHVYVSGAAGLDPRTGALAGDTIQDQARQALTNCETILRAAGASLDDVVEVGVLLTNPADFAGLNEEYARWFPADPPARYVAKLGRRAARAARLDPDDGLHRLIAVRTGSSGPPPVSRPTGPWAPPIPPGGPARSGPAAGSQGRRSARCRGRTSSTCGTRHRRRAGSS